MKNLYFTVFFLMCITVLCAQTNNVAQPGAGYIKYILHPETHTLNPSYDYSDKWDLDGDGKTDGIYFIGNGGAHTYYFLRIVLSTDSRTRDFRFIQLDMPYINNGNLPAVPGKHGTPQFITGDFDKDGVTDIFLNFDNSFSTLPKKWKRKGIKTKCVMMSFNRGTLRLSNP
jgi:hypothetical protein